MTDFTDSTPAESNLKSLRISSAVSIIVGTWSLLFEIYFFHSFLIEIYFARVAFTLIALLIFHFSFRKISPRTVSILIHSLIISMISSFIITIYKIPESVYINSQILSLLIFTVAIIYSWEVKNQIMVAIYYNLLFGLSIISSDRQIYRLPNLFSLLIFVSLISLLSIAASALNYRLRRSYQKKSDEINYIFNSVPVGICSTDLEGNIKTVNKFLAGLLEIDTARPMLKLYEYIKDELLEQYYILPTAKKIKHNELKASYMSSSGQEYFLKVIPAVQTGPDSEVTVELIIYDETRELTALREKEKLSEVLLNETLEKEKIASIALEEKNQKIQLLAKINHEVRSPLSSVIVFLEMMEEGMLSSIDDIMKYSRSVKAVTQSLLNTISNFIDYAKIGSGNLDVRMELFDLREEMQGVVDLLMPLAKNNLNTLVFQNMNRTGGLVYTDKIKLRQIVINLTSNSIKFTHEGRIDVIVSSVHIEGNNYELTVIVQDNGYGIEPEALPYIFEPYVTTGGRTAQASNGLGLVICREFTDLLKGRIKVESEPGKGTRFTVVIPYEFDYSALGD